MKYVEVIANNGLSGTASAIADRHEVKDFRLGAVGKDGMQPIKTSGFYLSVQTIPAALKIACTKYAGNRLPLRWRNTPAKRPSAKAETAVNRLMFR